MAADIKGVARFQKALIWLVLLHVGLIVANIWVGRAGGEEAPSASTAAITMALAVASLAVAVASIALIVLLMTALDRPLISKILAAIAMFIPLVGLIVLLVVNQRATGALRDAGYRVGLMGARPAG